MQAHFVQSITHYFGGFVILETRITVRYSRADCLYNEWDFSILGNSKKVTLRVSLEEIIVRRLFGHMFTALFHRRPVNIPVFSLLVVFTSFSSRGQVQTDEPVAVVLSRAYSMVKSNPAGAVKYFQRALELEPSNRETHEGLGYVYYGLGQLDSAVQHFTAAQAIRTSDTLQLQLAFTLYSMQRKDEAYTIYHELANSPAADIRAQALKQLAYESSESGSATSPTAEPPSDWSTRVYSASYYDSRWETSFFNLTAEEGYTLPGIRTLTLYGALAISADARSSGGLTPEIFSDNSLLLAVGIAYKPFQGLSVSAQQGAAFDLIGRSDVDFARPDFRFVANYGWGIYAPYTYHPDARFPFSPTIDLYASLGAYSRYKNTIGYLQIKGGLRTMEISHTVLDVYGKLNFARDAAVNLFQNESSVKPKEYYNNINEAGFGARLTPHVDWGLYLAAEYLRGWYSIESMVPSNRDQYYTSFRVYLIFDRTF